LWRWAPALVLCAFTALLSVPPAAAQNQPPPVIQRIDIVGNRRIPRDTLRNRIFSHEGDPYNEDTLHRDFLALWNTQYFEDIRLEVENSPDKPNAVVVVFYVKERPMIRHIKYKGNSSVSESDILDRFKERKVGLTVESPFDPTKIKRAETVLKELLAEHGRQFATVKPTYSRIAGTNAVELTFVIDEGPKVKVGKIRFVGNKAFSDRRIQRAMRNDRPVGFPIGPVWVSIAAKTFDRRKLDEDLEAGIRGLYQDNGYYTVVVKDPQLETVDVKGGRIFPFKSSKPGKATNITIEIEEGDRYRMGKLVVRSADPEHPELFFNNDFLANAFPIKKGDIFSTEKIRKSLEDYRKLFGNFGYIEFTATPITDPDPATKTVNLTLEFDQQKQYHVRRIEFSGNTTTRDKVIRRELLLDEGDLFSDHLWELSILRLNQLNYFDPIKKEENAELKRNPKEGTVDITLKVHEKGKQSIGLNGGVSGIEGTFIGFNYQTNNFLGLGETLNFSAQYGTLLRSYVFGFTEPYFRDKPISTGFTLFDTRYNFNSAIQTALLLGTNQPLFNDPNAVQNYSQSSKGFTVFASYPLKSLPFWRASLTYGYSVTDITAFSDASRLLFQSLQFSSTAGPSALFGINQSQITASATYNTTDSPINPTTGRSIFLSMAFVGGPLGGNVNTISPSLEYKRFIPVHHKRNVIGYRFLGAYTVGYGGKEVPPNTRLYMGGEQDIRGFYIRTLTPFAFAPTSVPLTVTYTDPTTLGPGGTPITRSLSVPGLIYQFSYPGGDLEGVGNFEYRFPIAGPVSMDYFVDVGAVGVVDTGGLNLNPAALANLKATFPPGLNAPLPTRFALASGSNFYPRMSTGLELVVQLPIVQVPFRLYYAYNPLRFSDVLQAPRGEYFLSDAVRASLPPGVLTGQVLPQLNSQLSANSARLFYQEPLRAIRFTVARTF
jgi:outer membrane protein insertion porin family